MSRLLHLVRLSRRHGSGAAVIQNSQSPSYFSLRNTYLHTISQVVLSVLSVQVVPISEDYMRLKSVDLSIKLEKYERDYDVITLLS